MRFKKHLTELSMKKRTVIDYFKKTPTEFYAAIGLPEYGEKEIFDVDMDAPAMIPKLQFLVYAASNWFTAYELEDNYGIKLKEGSKGLSVWDIGFEDQQGMTGKSAKAKGVALQLFAGLEEFLRTFYKKYKPQAIKFSGDREHIKLYDFLGKKITKIKPFEQFTPNIGVTMKYYWFVDKKELK